MRHTVAVLLFLYRRPEVRVRACGLEDTLEEYANP
jgi:hypothetical protein